ncbi:MAG: hypothetical protein H7Y88_05380 [Phycisphaerales bacterium]|nr:hypothetical protein [Phycisphaerales bacterium]
MRQQNKSSTTAHVYTHDAWNRLVKVQLDSVPPSTPITLNESEYNGLHWRTVKRADTTSVPNGLDQKRVMYYSAAWQMIQEDIDDSYVSSPGTNDRPQQVWGPRCPSPTPARVSHRIITSSRPSASSEKLSAKRRVQIAKKAAAKRWGKN